MSYGFPTDNGMVHCGNALADDHDADSGLGMWQIAGFGGKFKIKIDLSRRIFDGLKSIYLGGFLNS